VAAVGTFRGRGGPTLRSPSGLVRLPFSGCTRRAPVACWELIQVIAADAMVGAAAAFALEAFVVAPVVVKPQPQEKEADEDAIKGGGNNHGLRPIYWRAATQSQTEAARLLIQERERSISR